MVPLPELLPAGRRPPSSSASPETDRHPGACSSQLASGSQAPPLRRDGATRRSAAVPLGPCQTAPPLLKPQ